MKVSTENDNNFGYEKNTILVDNIPLSYSFNLIVPVIYFILSYRFNLITYY